MADLRDLIDAFDRLVGAASEVAPAGEVEAAARVARRARDRRGFLGETVVVALAGGTGSGKSSLVNALAGEDVAPTGARRPTTDRPLAWIPANPEPGLVRLLDALEIDERVGHDGLEWLAVVDLPDLDSVELDHRATVERLLPEVDAVVWVLDPEKYQDRALHEGYLRPLAGHADRFRFVLNQIDRVPSDQRQAMVDDLTRSLKAAGIDQPVIVTTAADPPVGPPEGIDTLVDTLGELGDAKELVTAKVVRELGDAADRLAEAAGAGSGTGFRERWEATLEDAAASLATDLISPGTVATAERVGSQAALRTASLLPGGFSPVEIPLGSARTGPGTRAAAERIDRLCEGLAGEVEGATRVGVRGVASGVGEEVEATAREVEASEVVTLDRPRAWWSWAGWARRIGAAVGVVALAWLADRLAGGGDLTLPVVVAVVGALTVLGLRAAVAASGASWVREAVLERREAVEEAARRALDRRLGRPLREVLRQRAGVGAALTEWRLTLSRWTD